MCELHYVHEYNKATSNIPCTSWHKNRHVHKEIFNHIISIINEEVLKKRNCVSLSSLCDMYNNELEYEQGFQPETDITLMTNHYLEEKIQKYFKKSVRIISRQKKKIIIHKDCSLLDNDLSKLEENDLIDKVALMLRNSILKIDKLKLPSKIKSNDLIVGECVIPDQLDRFFKVLIGGKDIRRRDGLNCSRLSSSMAADAIFCVSNGTVKPSKHITLGMTIKSLTSSKKVINILNRFGHCCNYTTLEELETEATISSVHRTQVCPPDIILNPSLCTGVAFDNLDRYVDTLSGKETLHDTVGIIYQNIDNSLSELNEDNDNSEELSLPAPSQKRKRSLTGFTPDIIPYSKRLKMAGRITPVEFDQQSSPSPENYCSLQTIDLLHLLSYVFHVPNTPSWTGFNCRMIEDNSPKQKVSYLTPINLSPTNVSVVVFTMEQAQKVGKECGQTYVHTSHI